MAFHLGCLRTLHRLGLLERARLLSAVSGGSVIAAMYAAHGGTFEQFEEDVQSILRTGFARPAIKVALTTMEGPKAVLCVMLMALAWLWSLPFKLVSVLLSALPISGGTQPGQKIAPGIARRFASRTTILRRTFDDLLFHGRTIGDLRPDRPQLVVVAAELRTGSAFYFGPGGAGSWRFGKVEASQIPLSQAVAASAAYPMFLPALDEVMTFHKQDGSLVSERVTLTDGGVYDNLGLSPLWPDRVSDVSVFVEEVDTIVACKAGYGLRLGNPSLFVVSRMKAVFGCIHNRAQNASMKRLFDLKAAGRIRAFALPMLDQDDSRLAYPPADLVSRGSVADYPTDFSAMSPDWIEKLSRRGEQITLAVIQEHAPDLLPAVATGTIERGTIFDVKHLTTQTQAGAPT